MFLKTITVEKARWIACVMTRPSSPGPTGLEFLFVRSRSCGCLVRYVWPMDRRSFRALIVDSDEVSDSVLVKALDRAIARGRTLEVAQDEEARERVGAAA